MFRVSSLSLLVLLFSISLGDFVNVTQTKGTQKCMNGYVHYNESCYNIHNKLFSWTEAMVFCRLFDGYLVVLDSPGEYAFLRGYLSEHGAKTATRYSSDQYGSRVSKSFVPNYWTGATAVELPGLWMWTNDKSLVNFSRFGGTRPGLNDNDCLMLDGVNGEYHAKNKNCHHREHFICERKH